MDNNTKKEGMYINRINSRNYAWAFLGLSTVIALVQVLRCLNYVFYPILHAEDGATIFPYYYHNAKISGIFRNQAGYVSLIQNTIAYLSIRLFSVKIVPYIWIALSLMLSTATISIFSLRRYRFVMPDDMSRVIVCLLLALIPLGHYSLVAGLTNTQWNIFYLALLLIIAPLPQWPLAKALQFVFLAFAVWSNPLSVLFIPICLLLLFVRTSFSERIVNAGIIVLTVLYGLVVKQSSNTDYQFDLFDGFILSLKYIAQRVVFESVFGNGLRVVLYHANKSWVIEVFALFIVCVLCLGVLSVNRKDNRSFRANLPLLCTLLYVVLASTFICVNLRFPRIHDNQFSTNVGQRYCYIQQKLFLLAALGYAVRLMDWRARNVAQKFVILLLIFSYAHYINTDNKHRFATSKERGIATMKFMELVNAKSTSRNGRGKHKELLILDAPGPWDIRLTIQGVEAGKSPIASEVEHLTAEASRSDQLAQTTATTLSAMTKEEIPLALSSEGAAESPRNALVARWSLEDLSDATDEISKKTLDFLPTDSVAVVQEVDGLVGGALRFDGKTTAKTRDAFLARDFGTRDVTLSCWMRTTTFLPNAMLCGWYGRKPSFTMFELRLQESGGRQGILFNLQNGQHADDSGGNNNVFSAVDNIADGAWHHIVGVREFGKKLRLYVDGLPAGWAQDKGWDQGGEFPFYLSGLYPYQGDIDEVTVWGRALTSAEVHSLYTQTLDGQDKSI